MTAPSGGRDVLAYRLAQALHDARWQTGYHADDGSEPFAEPVVPCRHCVEQADRQVRSLGPDAGAMRRALGDGAVVVVRKRLVANVALALLRADRLAPSEARDIANRCVNTALPGPDATGGA